MLAGFVGECRRLENANLSFGECRRGNESWHPFLLFPSILFPFFFSILSLQSRSCGALGSLVLEFGFSRMAAFPTFRRVIWNWSLSAAGLNTTVSQDGPRCKSTRTVKLVFFWLRMVENAGQRRRLYSSYKEFFFVMGKCVPSYNYLERRNRHFKFTMEQINH